MNQNDFYKELMSKYTFDSESIKAKAIKKAKRPFAERIISEHKAVSAVAAAALVLTAGVYGFVSLGGAASPLDIISVSDVGSASQRLNDAEQNYARLSGSADSENESVGMYISFNETISYSEALMTFSSVSDTGDIQPFKVYLSDGTVIDKAELSSYAALRNGEKTLIGMKIVAPVSYYTEIKELNIVYLVEIASETVSDATFVPIGVESDALSSIITTVTVPAVTTPPAEDITIGKSEDAVEITTDIVTNSTPAEDTEEEFDDEEEDENTETRPLDTTTTTTEPPEITAPDSIEINSTDILRAAVIDSDDIMILTKDKIQVYRLDESYEPVLFVEMSALSPKMEWSSAIVGHILISSCDVQGQRNTIIDYDIKTSEIYLYDLTAITTGCELGGVYYSDEGGCIFVKTVGAATTNVYHIDSVNGNTIATPIVCSSHPVTPLAFSKNVFTYAVSETDRTVVYALSKGSNAAIEKQIYTSDVVFTRSNFFDCYAATITLDDDTTATAITDRSGASYDIETSSKVVFGYDRENVVFGNSDNVYAIENGSIVVKPSDAEYTSHRFEGSAHVSEYAIELAEETKVVISKK